MTGRHEGRQAGGRHEGKVAIVTGARHKVGHERLSVDAGADAELVDAELASQTPLGRIAPAWKMAAEVALLSSHEAGYIRGAVPPVDGRISM